MDGLGNPSYKSRCSGSFQPLSAVVAGCPGLAVFRILQPLADRGLILLALDDTLARKRRLKMFGTGMHHDLLLSSRGKTVTSWIVLGVRKTTSTYAKPTSLNIIAPGEDTRASGQYNPRSLPSRNAL